MGRTRRYNKDDDYNEIVPRNRNKKDKKPKTMHKIEMKIVSLEKELDSTRQRLDRTIERKRRDPEQRGWGYQLGGIFCEETIRERITVLENQIEDHKNKLENMVR